MVSDKTKEYTFYQNIGHLVMVILSYFPAWGLSWFLIRFLNEKAFLTQSFLTRIVRSLMVSPIVLLFITLTINLARLIVYQSLDDDPFELQKTLFSLIISSVILLFTDFYVHDRNYKELRIQAEKDKNYELQLKNSVLKNQINPHFLFNSLNVLSSLIFIDQERANLFAKELSKLYRYIVKNTDEDSIPLRDEIAFVRAYDAILQLRFEGNVRIQIKAQRMQGAIVPTALQLLIENAQKHNAFSAEEPLDINIEIVEDKIYVVNNLNPKIVNKELSTNIGLHYLKEMYKKFDLAIEVDKQENSFVVVLPIIQQEKEVNKDQF